MASPSNCSFLFAFISLVCCFFFIENKPFVSAITRKEGSELQQTHHHVPLASLFPSSSCSPPPQGASRKGSLQVIHKHGSCSKLNQHTSSSSSSVKAPFIIPHGEILERDEVRVRAIHSKIWEEQRQQKEAGRTSEAWEQVAAPAEAPLPALSGEILGTDGEYFVRVGLGTPAKELSLVFDTGSDLTWTQCLPCLGVDSCYTQNEPIFDPSHSSSYSDIPCPSSQCSLLFSATGNQPTCSESTCIYGITYGDKSFSTGNFAKETLTITSTNVVDNFLFGCGHDNEGLFNATAGLLGLGRNPISFVQQTANKFNKIFSYCIPPTANDVGYLTFGDVPSSDNISYTPFFSIPNLSTFYALHITEVALAGTSLSITPSVFSSGVIIDSGTVITRLPPAAYEPLRDAFRSAMSRYPMAASISIFDTCYDLSGHKTIVVPKVTLSFEGGVNLELDAIGLLYAVSETQVCFAFAANENANYITIIGNAQQRTLEVVYDVGGGKIGFRPAGCSGSAFSVGDGDSPASLNRPNLTWMVCVYILFTCYFLKF